MSTNVSHVVSIPLSKDIRVTNETNQRFADKIEKILCKLFFQMTQKGCYGKGTVQVIVQDGIIQHIVHSIEQLEH